MSNLKTGENILVECLLREGVDCLFGYPEQADDTPALLRSGWEGRLPAADTIVRR